MNYWGKVPGENLMEEKTADQGGPEGENPNEEGVEGEIPGGDGDKGGNSLMTLVRRTYKRPEPPNLQYKRP